MPMTSAKGKMEKLDRQQLNEQKLTNAILSSVEIWEGGTSGDATGPEAPGC